jgi:hypothetical protein
MILQTLSEEGQLDQWSYIWGNNTYSVSKVYNHLLGQEYVHATFRWIWKSCWQSKHKVFFWLLLRNRLNTRGLLQRKNMALYSYTCEMCVIQRVETLRYLFLHCSFAKNCWTYIEVLVPPWLRADRATSYMKMHINQPFVMKIIVIMSWCIWKERNV